MRLLSCGVLVFATAVAACGARVSGERDGASGDADASAQDAVVVPVDVPPVQPVTCAPGAWCWQHPRPQGHAINAVYTASAREAWAVGDHGAVMHWLEGAWSEVASGTDIALHGVWGSSGDDVWAWGTTSGSDTRSVLLHREGGRFVSVPFGLLPRINSFAASARDNVWIATAGNSDAALLRWNGSAFVTAPAMPAGVRPVTLCTRSAGEVWATTNTSRDSFAIAIHRWDGATWREVMRAPQGERFSSPIVCPAEGVALAEYFVFDAGETTYIEVREGRVGGDMLPLGRSPRLFRTAHNEAYFANASEGTRWTPAGWERRFVLDGQTSVFSINFDFLLDASAGWFARGTPTPVRWTGMRFDTESARETPALGVFFGPEGQEPSAVFGAGVWGRREENRWVFSELGLGNDGMVATIQDLWSPSADSAWLVGSTGVIARYDARAGTVQPAMLEPGGAWLDVDGSDAQNVWAVGENAAIVRLSADGRWVAPPVALPTEVDGVRLTSLTLTAVDVRSANDVLVLGNDPAGGRFVTVLFRFDGTRWVSELAVPGGGTLAGMARGLDGTVYLAGGNTLQSRPAAGGMWTMLPTVEGSVQRLQRGPMGAIEAAVLLGPERGRTQLFSLAAGSTRMVPVGVPVVAEGIAQIRRGAGAALWAAGASGAILRYAP
ncbi:MAG: hypothetical protein Q8Q09_19265 [Deltaproteobacteria bacterium]|nr:hypothetical protein [Deltaproteobacteria bacterium]